MKSLSEINIYIQYNLRSVFNTICLFHSVFRVLNKAFKFRVHVLPKMGSHFDSFKSVMQYCTKCLFFFLFLFSVDQLIYVSQLCYNGDFEKELSLSSSIIFSKWLPSWKKELLKGLGSYIRILSLVIC